MGSGQNFCDVATSVSFQRFVVDEIFPFKLKALTEGVALDLINTVDIP